MAGLDAISAILGILNISFNVAEALFKYIKSVKHVEEEIRDLHRQIVDTSSVLRDIPGLLELHFDSRSGLFAHTTVECILRNSSGYMATLWEIKGILNPLCASGTHEVPVSKRHKMKWPYAKYKIEESLTRLRAIQIELQLTLSLAACNPERVASFHRASRKRAGRPRRWRMSRNRPFDSCYDHENYPLPRSFAENNPSKPPTPRTRDGVEPGPSTTRFGQKTNIFKRLRTINWLHFMNPKKPNSFEDNIVTEGSQVEEWMLDFSTNAWIQCVEYSYNDLPTRGEERLWRQYSQEKFTGTGYKRKLLSIRFLKRAIRVGILRKLEEPVALHVQILRTDTCTPIRSLPQETSLHDVGQSLGRSERHVQSALGHRDPISGRPQRRGGRRSKFNAQTCEKDSHLNQRQNNNSSGYISTHSKDQAEQPQPNSSLGGQNSHFGIYKPATHVVPNEASRPAPSHDKKPQADSTDGDSSDPARGATRGRFYRLHPKIRRKSKTWGSRPRHGPAPSQGSFVSRGPL
ncbi:predicted protein [Uncinocarpus reesii 1704]|uniref:Fungal N-terminal domain-containing protein n=1 Tax=Uncinocarpus reesii (strain UAMH 1704) TaxID=336963 RepID=C4JP87_UNCRE|nr:uncharacterized protein UREG_04469 [Uncinocarpus reesii 1704]EEP79623.1 predicted protein [Uncinocarpus reesii 1704]